MQFWNEVTGLIEYDIYYMLKRLTFEPCNIVQRSRRITRK